MNYIGVDCHISTLDFAVVSERGIVKNKARVKTSVKGFMEFIKTVPKPRKIFIEEGTLCKLVIRNQYAIRGEINYNRSQNQ